jgi:hypothetical protein
VATPLHAQGAFDPRNAVRWKSAYEELLLTLEDMLGAKQHDQHDPMSP